MTLTEARERYVVLLCSAGSSGLLARMLIETNGDVDAVYRAAVRAFSLANEADRITF